MLRQLTRSSDPVDRLGVRLRGLEMTRLETFVDAAFAFSVTMLALSPDRVPSSFAEMYDLLRGVPAFLFSLAILMLFWNGHVRFSRRYGLDDGATMLLSSVFIAVMLIYVYPLKFMASAFFAFYIPPLRTASSLQSGTPADLSTIFIVMGSGFVLLHVVVALLHVHALRKADGLGLSDHERRVTRCEIGDSLIYLGVGAASIALAVAFRNSLAVVSAGFVYASLGLLIPAYWVWRGPSDEECRQAREAAGA